MRLFQCLALDKNQHVINSASVTARSISYQRKNTGNLSEGYSYCCWGTGFSLHFLAAHTKNPAPQQYNTLNSYGSLPPTLIIYIDNLYKYKL